MSSLLRSFYHNLKEPIIICDLIEGTFYQNKACKDVFGVLPQEKGLHALKKIGYKFYFDFCNLDSDNIVNSPFEEAINSKWVYTSYGIYQKNEREFLYFTIKAFSLKKYRIIYFYDYTKELECEKIFEENEKLKLQNQEFANTNSKAQNQAVKMALLNRISTSLSKTLDLNTLINGALKELSIIFGANRLYFAKRKDKNDFIVEYVYPQNINSEDKNLFYGDKTLDVLFKNEPYIVTTIKEHDKSKKPSKIQNTRIIIPLFRQEELYGIIIIFTSKKNVSDLEKESVTLKSTIAQLNHLTKPDAIKKDYERFFDMAKQYTHIEELTRDTLLTFVDRIEIGPKILPDGTSKVTHRNQPYRQSVRIFYRFIGEVKREATRDLPIGATGAPPSTQVGVSILNGTEVVDSAQNPAS